MAKAEKKDVDYSIGMKKSHCGKTFKDDDGHCKHFRESRDYDAGELGLCEKVSGSISPVYWCKLWEKAN